MKGTAYGVGVGPGDPELMTLKAVRMIKENTLFAVPGKDPAQSVAYKIAVRAVPELAEKEVISVNMPMVKNREQIGEDHKKGARILEEYLDQGRNVVFLTLGDPTVYCTFSYLQHILEADGYNVELVSGVTSFCAAAARLNIPLGEWDEPIHIIPAAHKTEDFPSEPGNYVLMKSASHMKEVKKILKESGRFVNAVIDCGMESEIICRSADEIPDEAGYFSLVIAKEKQN